MTKRRNFSDSFKATVALEALRGDKAVQEVAAKRQLHPTQVSTWKRQAIEGMAGVFSDRSKRLRTRTARSKNCTPRLVNWRWRTIFCHKG
ncbi:transposase [Sulfitobacter sp.]|uniref:transposase n=1 Tax=Sulfitobacter sp. TaxID=1903071 RepID=UPI003FCD8D73